MQKIISLLYVLCLCTFIACEAPKAKPQFTSPQQFSTTDPERLYFKNMRSAYYYRSRRPNSKKDIYTLKKATKNNKYPLINPLIINDWMNDKAYIFLQKNDYKKYPDPLQIHWKNTDTLGTYTLVSMTKEAQFEFAGKLYNALLEGHQLHLINTEGDSIPIFDIHQDRKNFALVMRDYYKLTD